MKHMIAQSFKDGKHAGEAIKELKRMGFADDISVMAGESGAVTNGATEGTRDLGKEAAKGASTGSLVGGTLGAIGGLLAGATAFSIPGVGIAVLGPLVTTFAGAGAGGAAGSIVGALVDLGIPDDEARAYEAGMKRGETLVTVHVEDADDRHKVQEVLRTHKDMESGKHHRGMSM